MSTLNFFNRLNNVVENGKIKGQLLKKLNQITRSKMEREGGDINVDLETGAYSVAGCSESLTAEILEELG